jgi:hypothetical protein
MILISTIVLHKGQCCAILKVRVKNGIEEGGGAVREEAEKKPSSGGDVRGS